MAATFPIPIDDPFDPATIRPEGMPGRDIADDPKWALLERILQSKGFRKSQRPSDFLLYICRKALSGQTSELSEQDIGENVFTRREGFDPGLDNIVRVTARRVRQKLEEYYAAEGRAESMVLSVPVGGYIPRFDERNPLIFDPVIEPEPVASVVAPLPVAEERGTGETKSSGVPLGWIVVSVVTIAIVFGGMNVWRYRAHEAELDLPANAMWSTLFDPSRRSIFVPGDSALVLLENHTHHPVALSDYISKRYLADIPDGSQYPANIAREEAERPYNSVVDVRFVAQIARLPEAIKPIDIVLSRDLSLEDLKESDVILSGAREADPWMQMFQDSLDYSIVDRQQGSNYTVINHHPAAGEQQTYSYTGDDNSPHVDNAPAHVAYAIVAYMPNLSGQGRVLLLQGTTMAGTEAGMDFVLDRDGLNKFLASHTQHRQVQPFQVLLETTNINGSSPRSRILSYRFH
jgi:hypothetical protein